jgi:2-polyprenyl-3-methyl-5-hydroxy-6-metoxy-1,4-benzoquinol methylase
VFRTITGASEEREARPCPACGHGDASRAFGKDTYDYARCRRCGLVFINPIPIAGALADSYDDLSREYFLDERRKAIDEYPQRHAREIALLTRIGATGRLLDVGCATGSFMMAARTMGFRVIKGVDIAAPSVALARERGFEATAGDFPAGLFAPDSFDIVTMWNTLEHLPSPFAFLEEAHRVVAPGGYVAVSVPNYASLSVRLLGTRYRYIALEHLNYFTAATLGLLLRRAGFEVVHAETRSFNPYVVWQDWRGASAGVEETIRETELSKSFKTQAGFAPARLAYTVADRVLQTIGWGDSLLMAARKAPRQS